MLEKFQDLIQHTEITIPGGPILQRSVVLIMLNILIGLYFLYAFESFEPIGESTGTLTGLYQRQTEEGSPTRFVVKLDSGKTVTLDAIRMRAYQEGRRVIVAKWRSKWFHRVHYTFERYVEIPDGIHPIP